MGTGKEEDEDEDDDDDDDDCDDNCDGATMLLFMTTSSSPRV